MLGRQKEKQVNGMKQVCSCLPRRSQPTVVEVRLSSFPRLFQLCDKVYADVMSFSQPRNRANDVLQFDKSKSRFSVCRFHPNIDSGAL